MTISNFTIRLSLSLLCSSTCLVHDYKQGITHVNNSKNIPSKALIVLTASIGLAMATLSSAADILQDSEWQVVAKDAYFSYAIDPQHIRSSVLASNDAKQRILDVPIKVVTLKDIPKYDYHKHEMAVQFNHYDCSTQQFSIGQIRSYTADGTLFDDDPTDTVEWISTEEGSPSRVILKRVCTP